MNLTRYLFLVVVGCLLISGCATVIPERVSAEDFMDEYGDDMKNELDFHRNLWQRHKVQHYSYSYQLECFCRERAHVVIEMHNKSIVYAQVVETGSFMSSTSYGDLMTIEKMFNFLEEQIDKKNSSLQIQYDSKWGFPNKVYVALDIEADANQRYYQMNNLKLIVIKVEKDKIEVPLEKG